MLLARLAFAVGLLGLAACFETTQEGPTAAPSPEAASSPPEESGGAGADPSAPGGAAAASAPSGASGAIYFTFAGKMVRYDVASRTEATRALDSDSERHLGYGAGLFTDVLDGPPSSDDLEIRFFGWNGGAFVSASRAALTFSPPRTNVNGAARPSPDGRLVALATRESEGLGYDYLPYVRLLDAKGTTIARIGGAHDVVWRSASELVLAGEDGIYVANASSSPAPKRAIALADAPSHLALAPDGETVAFLMGDALYRVSLSGKGLLQLTQPYVGHGWPAWSPDGSAIAITMGVCSYTYAAKLVVLSATASLQKGDAAARLTGADCHPLTWLAR